MVGILVSLWDGLVSGVMLVSGSAKGMNISRYRNLCTVPLHQLRIPKIRTSQKERQDVRMIPSDLVVFWGANNKNNERKVHLQWRDVPGIEIHLGVCLLSWNHTMYVDKYRYSYGYKMYLVKPNNNSQSELRLLLQTFRFKTTCKVSATEVVLVCPDILQSVHIIAIYCLIEYEQKQLHALISLAFLSTTFQIFSLIQYSGHCYGSNSWVQRVSISRVFGERNYPATALAKPCAMSQNSLAECYSLIGMKKVS